jgi:uncharacterized protein YukE
MAIVRVDPEELRNFANTLIQFNDIMENATGQLRAHFSGLGTSWDDGKRRQFEEVFDELVQTLSHFRDISAEQVAYLYGLAERADDYLNA